MNNAELVREFCEHIRKGFDGSTDGYNSIDELNEAIIASVSPRQHASLSDAALTALRAYLYCTDVLAYGCEAESMGLNKCERWCHQPFCAVTFKDAPPSPQTGGGDD